MTTDKLTPERLARIKELAGKALKAERKVGFHKASFERSQLAEALPARTILALVEAAERGGGEGWVAVPKEPTDKMADAYYEAHARSVTVIADPYEIWSAMIAAAGRAALADLGGE